MIDPQTPADNGKPDEPFLPRVTIAASLLVLILAVGAIFFPPSGQFEMRGILLVFNPPGPNDGREELFHSLADYLGVVSGHKMDLVVATNREEFLHQAKEGVDFVFCPDGLALDLNQGDYGIMVAGRRKLPANLRPRGVVVFRISKGPVPRPWETHPSRMVFGDSLSLVSIGGVGLERNFQDCAFGPDPYDHRPVLHALRLGAFDFAMVRQWDAAEFFSSGLLDDSIWGVENQTIPVPDIVMMASSRIPLVERLKWADLLAMIGRSGDSPDQKAEQLATDLVKLRLAGFNILLEPDFELVRRKYSRHWPAAVD
jgi:hypothetical protein